MGAGQAMRPRLEELLAALRSCERCRVLGRPFLAHRVYELWLPSQVELLLITESPPPGRKADFFYNLSKPDRLRRNMRVILGLEVPEREVPAWLREHGIFLTNAVKCRPPAGERGYRDEKLLRQMALRCAHHLALEVAILRPKHVMALGQIAGLAAEACGLELYATFPHPNYVVRFGRHLIPSLREAIFKAVEGAEPQGAG